MEKIHAGCTRFSVCIRPHCLSHRVGPSRVKPALEKRPGLVVATAPARLGCLASRDLASCSSTAPPPVFNDECSRCLPASVSSVWDSESALGPLGQHRHRHSRSPSSLGGTIQAIVHMALDHRGHGSPEKPALMPRSRSPRAPTLDTRTRQASRDQHYGAFGLVRAQLHALLFCADNQVPHRPTGGRQR